MTTSGTTAIVTALLAVNVGPGDEVIVPAVSWSTTYFPVTQTGLKLRFVDVEASTLNIDPDLACAAITPRTRAILAVNLLGNPARLDRLRAICDRHDLLLIEDNCESMGASLDGRAAGA